MYGNIPYSLQVGSFGIPEAHFKEFREFVEQHQTLILEHAEMMKRTYIGIIAQNVLFARAATILWYRFASGDPTWQHFPTPLYPR